MNPQRPKTPDTNPITLDNSLNGPLEAKNEGWGEEAKPIDGPSREDLNRFHERVAVAIETKVGNELPEIEAPRRVISYFNRHSIKGFDDAGYFVYRGVKVFETGKREEISKRDKRTMEEINFGGHK